MQISNASSNGNTSNNSEFFKGGDIPFNQWTHVAVTYDGSVGKVYQNGQLVAENQIDVNINAGGSALNIGSLKSSNGTWYLFDGKLDELGYWNKVLSAEKIGNLFSNSADILLNGTISAENNQIKNVADPTNGKDAVNKDYLLEKIALLQDQIDALQSTTGSGTVTDQDGNSYPYLTYGDQVWAVKNAEMITYRMAHQYLKLLMQQNGQTSLQVLGVIMIMTQVTENFIIGMLLLVSTTMMKTHQTKY